MALVRRVTWPSSLSQNGWNGPHPAESLPSAGEEAAARHGRRRTASFFSTGEQSSGRSCLPQIRFPPSATEPTAFTATREALETASRGGLRRWGREDKVPARDSTRDSITRKELQEEETVCVRERYGSRFSTPMVLVNRMVLFFHGLDRVRCSVRELGAPLKILVRVLSVH